MGKNNQIIVLVSKYHITFEIFNDILEWPFIVASLRHTFAIIMLFNQHLDMPVRWMDYLSKGEVLTNTDLDRCVNNI